MGSQTIKQLTRSKKKKMLNKQEINEIFRRFSINKPDPKIELSYYSDYTLLVAVILSAQSTDKGVNKITPDLFLIADTPKKMLALGKDGLKEKIKSIGLYNSKADNIIKTSQILVDKYASIVPDNLPELEKLPGVGRKTANVILNCLHNLPVMAVDTHVFRVSNRIRLCNSKSPNETEAQLYKVIPKEWLLKAHFWLVLHGRYTCKARKPECSKCLINDICKYEAKNF